MTATPTNSTHSRSSDAGVDQLRKERVLQDGGYQMLQSWSFGPATDFFPPSPQEVKDNIHHNSNNGLADGNKLTPAQSSALNNTIDTLDENGYSIPEATFSNGELSLSAFKDLQSGNFPAATKDGAVSQDILIYPNGGTYNDTKTTSGEFNPDPKK